MGTRTVPDAYVGSDFMRVLMMQPARQARAAFLDVDKTMYMPGGAPPTKPFLDYLAERYMPHVLVTGNDFQAIRPRLESGAISADRHVIAGAVGTEIMVCHTRPLDLPGQVEVTTPLGRRYYAPDLEWEAKLQATGYNRLALSKVAGRFIELMNQTARGYELQFQQPDVEAEFHTMGQLPPAIRSQRYKLSFHFMANSPAMVREMELQARRFFGHNIVVCGEIGYNDQNIGRPWQKYCLDVLATTKAECCRYIARVLNVEHTITGGDSGNDIDMLLHFGQLAIVVGGARWELKEAVVNYLRASNAIRRQHFHTVRRERGQSLAFYIEEDENRIGPDSLLRAIQLWNY